MGGVVRDALERANLYRIVLVDKTIGALQEEELS